MNPSLRCSRTLTVLEIHIKNQVRTGDYFKQSIMYLDKFKILTLHSNTMVSFTGLGMIGSSLKCLSQRVLTDSQ